MDDCGLRIGRIEWTRTTAPPPYQNKYFLLKNETLYRKTLYFIYRIDFEK